FDGAASLLAAAEAPPADEWAAPGVPGIELARVITDHFLSEQARTGPAVVEARTALEQQALPRNDSFATNTNLILAYLAAIKGKTAETERLVRRWFREAEQDLAERVILRHHACRALGLAGATSAAVECLRSAIAEPSQVHPFIEPHLPYYDPIRNDPAYADFMTDT
ncbi:MAG: hypothetical protein ACNS61_14145, partial [Candidatus Wenzhouxiangella sp. M2_3B_020]